MNNWYDITPTLGAYNYNSTKEDVRLDDYNIELKDNLSPITNVFLDLFSNTIFKKNLIISSPINVLRTIPILSFIYTEQTKKSTLIFTTNRKGLNNKSIKDFHNLNYCMLSKGNGGFVSFLYLIGFIQKNILKSQIKFPKSSTGRRLKNTRKNLIDRFESSEAKIILFSDDDLNIIDRISEIKIFTKNYDEETDIDIGFVIFENVDLYINSYYTSKNFLQWIKKYEEKNIRFLFHFSNPNSKYIDLLKNETDSFVIPFNHLLIKDTCLHEKSKDYYNNYLNKFPKRREIITNYNLDNKLFFNEEILNSNDENFIEIVQPLIEIGNFEDYYMDARRVLKYIDTKKVVNKRFFRSSKKLLYSFLDLSVSPLSFKVKFCDENYKCRYYPILLFLDNFKKSLYKEKDNLTKDLLNDFIDSLISITYELGKSKHFNEPNSFDRIGKDYMILDIAKNKENYFNNSNDLIICCYNSIEVSIIAEKLKKFNIEGVFVKDIDWLSKSLLDNKEEYNLLLPGALHLKYLSELLMPYRKILILSYEGRNLKKITEQIESINYINQLEFSKLQNYFLEIFNYLGIESNQLLEDISNNMVIDDVISDFIEADTKDIDFSDDYIFSFIKNIFKDSEFSEEYDDSEEIENEIHEENSKIRASHESTTETTEFELKNIETDEIIIKRLPINKSFSYFNRSNKLMEGPPKVIKKGDFLIFIDNDDKKTLLELIIEVYDLEFAVDKDSIEYWKNKLIDYFESNNLKYTTFNEKFNSIGGNKTIPATSSWIKGEVIGPKYANDLYLLGKLMDDDLLIENYGYMFSEIEKIRTIHRVTGRRINNIIKGIMSDRNSINPENLGYFGQLFYEKIRNGVYEVMDKS